MCILVFLLLCHSQYKDDINTVCKKIINNFLKLHSKMAVTLTAVNAAERFLSPDWLG